MECRYNAKQLIKLVDKQINNYWPYDFRLFMRDKSNVMRSSILRLEKSLSALNNKYINRDGTIYFNIEHSVSYSIFLYILSNELYRSGGGQSMYII